MTSLLKSDFKGTAKRLDKYDVPMIAQELRVTEDELYAFMDTETRDSGFDKLGRPQMLFEPHKFYANTSGADREKAVAAGLAYPKWGTRPYPKDSYPRLKAAMKINEAAALKSASYGASQVLGSHHKLLGYKTVQDMVRAFMDDEENHIRGMVAYMKSVGIDEDLRKLASVTGRDITAADCVPAVRKYNGKEFAKNNYHVKFAENLNRRRRIPNAVIPPELIKKAPLPEEPVQEPLVNPELDFAEIKFVQKRLAELGYPEVGNADGRIGTKTRGAILAFEADNGLPLTGEANFDLIVNLNQAGKRPVAPERATATKETIAAKPAVAVTASLEKLGTGLLATSGVGAVIEGTGDLQKVVDSANKFKALTDSVMSLGPWVLTGIAGFAALYLGRKVLAHLIKEYREGRLL